MKAFDIKSISENICANLEKLGPEFNADTIFKSIYTGPKDPSSILEFLINLHFSKRDYLDKQLTRWLMDLEPLELDAPERLLLRFRFENAAGNLDLLSTSRTPRQLPTLRLHCREKEEAVLWALTVFWDFCGMNYLQRVVQSIASEC